jgi:hypothetical protein
MRGYGRSCGKQHTENMLDLDIRRLQREGQLAPTMAYRWLWLRHERVRGSVFIRVGASQVWLTHDSDGEPLSYEVEIARTACHLGGHRLWWRCPIAPCGRRVAVLYGGRSGHFACRHCWNLAYASQSEDAFSRAIRRAGKLRAKLEWQAGIINPEGPKPKGMHWRTFERLRLEQQQHASRAVSAMSEWLPSRRSGPT